MLVLIWMASPYKSLFRIRNIPLTRILTRVFAYLSPFISQILDFIYWTVLIFIRSILNGVTLKTSYSDCRVIVASLKQNTAGKKEREPTTKKTKIILLLVARGGDTPYNALYGKAPPERGNTITCDQAFTSLRADEIKLWSEFSYRLHAG